MAYSVSSTFRTALEGSHNVVILATICDSNGSVLATLRPLGGEVSVDIDRSVRRSAGDLELIDPDGTLRPIDATNLLSPLTGYELRLYRGIEFPSGTTELIPLGIFGWSTATIMEGANGITLSIGNLQDRSTRISSARYSRAINVIAGTSVEAAIARILEQAWVDVSYSGGTLMETGRVMPAVAYGAEGDADPWEDARALADAQGFRLYFDVLGEVALSPINGANEVTAVVSYGTTYSNLMITELTKTWDSTDTFNGVFALGEGSGLLFPFRGVAWDDDPVSPTYYLGNFGKRPRYFSDPTIINQAQADASAESQLKKTLGIAEKLTWSQLVDPSLDVDDGVNVYDEELGVNRLYRLDRLTIPLAASSPMSAEARTRRVSF
jgi:hypothetical protein